MFWFWKWYNNQIGYNLFIDAELDANDFALSKLEQTVNYINKLRSKCKQMELSCV